MVAYWLCQLEGLLFSLSWVEVYAEVLVLIPVDVVETGGSYSRIN